MKGPFTALAAKEFRALLPVGAAAALTIAADPLVRRAAAQLFPLGTFAYIVGTLALGAHAIGHEFTNRTLPGLLAQPWKRSSILLTKTLVLAGMLLGLALVAWPVLFGAHARTFADLPRYPTLILPLAGGLFVAPFVTMRLRSQMAGVVFTSAIPGTTYLLALLAGVSVYGIGSDAAEVLAGRVWLPAMAIFAAAGAVLSARSFLRLQDTGDAGEELRLPAWLTLVDRNPLRPPLWMLVKKELRLQQMTFALVLLFAGIWAAGAIAGRLNPTFAIDFPLRGIGLLYFALLPLLIGSLASAQERQFGMLDSQAMLPVPFAQQWAVKAGVVLVLAVVLGVLVPWLVFVPPRASIWPLAASVLLLTMWSLYISSWCGSGVIALALVLPASAAALIAVRSIDWVVTWLAASRHGLYPAFAGPSAAFTAWSMVGLPSALLLVAFAGRNHRVVERGPKILALQIAWAAGVLLVSDAVMVLL